MLIKLRGRSFSPHRRNKQQPTPDSPADHSSPPLSRQESFLSSVSRPALQDASPSHKTFSSRSSSVSSSHNPKKRKHDMSDLLILGDADMRDLLHSLNKEDVDRLQDGLAEALHTYSTGTQDESACSANQPMRSVMQSAPGVSTLFMPARTSQTTGIKIVTVAEDKASLTQTRSNETSSTKSETPSSSVHHDSVSSASGSLSGLSISSSESGSDSTRAGTVTPTSSVSSTSIPGSVFDPTSEPADPLSAPSISPYAVSTRPQGSLTILSPSGTPSAIINANTLTAFRTALTTTLLLRKRDKVHTLTVFGAGAQAYWHIRLALLLRSPEIHHVHIIARTFARASLLIKTLYAHSVPDTSDFKVNLSHPDSAPALVRGVKFTILTPEYSDYGRLLREQVRAADVLLTCTASAKPLFPPELLTSTEGRRKGRLVAAIGSYKPHMCELPHEVLLDAVKPATHHHPHLHRHAERGGVVVVDTLAGAINESGEVRKAKLSGDQLVEVGELVMIKRAVLKENEAKGIDQKTGQQNSALYKWLTAGNVVYKCVGLGLMDLAVGEKIVDLARERALGTIVQGF